MKRRRTRRGKPSSAKRIAAWRERANRAYAQWSMVEIEMGVLVKSSRMTAAIQLYHERLPQLSMRRVVYETSLTSHARQEKTTSPHGDISMLLDSSLFWSTRSFLGYVHRTPPCEFAVMFQLSGSSTTRCTPLLAIVVHQLCASGAMLTDPGVIVDHVRLPTAS